MIFSLDKIFPWIECCCSLRKLSNFCLIFIITLFNHRAPRSIFQLFRLLKSQLPMETIVNYVETNKERNASRFVSWISKATKHALCSLVWHLKMSDAVRGLYGKETKFKNPQQLKINIVPASTGIVSRNQLNALHEVSMSTLFSSRFLGILR